MTAVNESVRSEADDATRGSAVKLVAEVASRLIGVATTFLLLRGLGAAGFGAYGELSVCALLLAELGELGLQALASRALVAGTISLRSLARARLVSGTLAAVVALAAIPGAPAVAALVTRVARFFGSAQEYRLDGPTLALLIGWFVLSGWGEFIGVALRCRRARRSEAVLLLVLRTGALVFAGAALVAGAELRGVSVALALSPLPALGLGALLLARTAPSVPGVPVAPGAVLRESAPLAIHGGLLLLSPRVEFLVLSFLSRDATQMGLFFAALNVIWFLAMVPSAIAAGAMPALTREALRGKGAVRLRTSATLALIAVPAATSLAQLAPSVSAFLSLLSRGFRPALSFLIGGAAPALAREHAVTAVALAVMALAVPAMFLNALVTASLIAAGRARWLPWLTGARVALAFALAFVLVPRLGVQGAAMGLVLAEWALLGFGALACHRAGFDVPLGAPLASGVLASAPMAFAVHGTSQNLLAAVVVGALTWAATLLAASRLAPGLVRQLTGDVRYP
jgi:O-antigen/teichoic acid export membrane protein